MTGRRGAPRPPRELEAEMERAGREGDQVALGIAHARYAAWAADNGWTPHHEGRPPRADEAAR